MKDRPISLINHRDRYQINHSWLNLMLIQLPARSSFDKVLHGDEGDITSVLGPKRCLHTSSGSLPNPCPGLGSSGQYCSLWSSSKRLWCPAGHRVGHLCFWIAPPVVVEKIVPWAMLRRDHTCGWPMWILMKIWFFCHVLRLETLLMIICIHLRFPG